MVKSYFAPAPCFGGYRNSTVGAHFTCKYRPSRGHPPVTINRVNLTPFEQNARFSLKVATGPGHYVRDDQGAPPVPGHVPAEPIVLGGRPDLVGLPPCRSRNRCQVFLIASILFSASPSPAWAWDSADSNSTGTTCLRSAIFRSTAHVEAWRGSSPSRPRVSRMSS